MSDDPREWFTRMLKAIDAAQRGNESGVQGYGKWVAEHRGRKAAQQAVNRVRELARNEGWQHASLMLNDYRAGRALGRYAAPVIQAKPKKQPTLF